MTDPDYTLLEIFWPKKLEEKWRFGHKMAIWTQNGDFDTKWRF
jgi:hypothetical protein